MNNEKEQWKDSILNSLEGIKRAEPKAALLKEIVRKVEVDRLPTQIISMNRVRMAAAAAILLLALNAFSISSYLKKTTYVSIETTSNEKAPSLITHYNLYD